MHRLKCDLTAIIGRVNSRDIPQTSDVDGRLHWQRPGGSEGDVSLTGSAYARPAVGSRVLWLPRAASNARLTFSGRIQLGAGIGRVSFGGVLLPKTGVGRGQVFFPNAIGEVELAAP